MKTTETHHQTLLALARMPQAEFLDVLSRAKQLYSLLYAEAESGARHSEDHADPRGPGIPESPEGIRRRPQMRDPAPGSLRETVYEILQRQGGPIQRKEIIEQVAAMRGVPVSESLKAATGEVLRNQHDPHIRRVATGIYALAA